MVEIKVIYIYIESLGFCETLINIDLSYKEITNITRGFALSSFCRFIQYRSTVC